jgi:oligopeptide transport system substrate-binding protein
MKSQKWMALLLIVAMFATLMAGCGSSSSSAKEQVLRVRVGGEPGTLDPNKSTGVPESNYQLAMYEGLSALDAKDIPVPAAAEKWDISPDGLKYTFYIRQNAKWSNGDPVTAHDFEFAWKRALSAELASEYAYMLFMIKNAEAYNAKKVSADQVGVKAINDKTLEVVLEKPTAYFLSICSFHTAYPVHKKTVEANPDKWANDVKTIIANGPFKPANWVHNSKLEMVKNDQYWDKDKVKLSKIEWILTESNTTALSMFENNQLDYANDTPNSEADRLKKENKLVMGKYLGTYYYSFNNKKAPFDNPKVRKAFTLAIDRETLVKTVLKDMHTPAYAWVPPGLTNPSTGKDFREEGGSFFKGDVEQAKKLLAEAGYPNGQGLPSITLIYNTNDNHKAIAEAIQEMWKKNLGVTVNIQNQEWKVFLKTRKLGDYQVARHGWIGDYPDPMTFVDTFITKGEVGGVQTGGNNDADYSNKEYDRLLDIAQRTNDQKVRMQAMHDAEKLLFEDMGIMPIYFYNYPYVVKPNVKNFIQSPLALNNFKEAYIQK